MNFSQLSESKLSTCHPDLITVAHKAIVESPHDFKITHGHRSSMEQFELFKKGREYDGEHWVIVDKSKVVTNCDGIRIKSKHNQNPSFAFDIAILIDNKVVWDAKYYEDVALHIIIVANDLINENKISRMVRWGGTFKNYDGPHFEII